MASTNSLLQTVRNSYKVQRAGQEIARFFWSGLAPLRRLWLPVTIRRRPEVNVHFGCGSHADPRFINADARAMAHVHLVTKSPMLKPLGDGTADSFYACHVFEHLSFHHQDAVLKRWFDILKPGGSLVLSVPDFDKMVDAYHRADRNPRAIQARLMGGQDYPGNFHFAILTDGHLRDLLQKAGFVDIESWHPRDQPSWPRDFSWADDVSLNLRARKPARAVSSPAP